jgi:hypothetical protein
MINRVVAFALVLIGVAALAQRGALSDRDLIILLEKEKIISGVTDITDQYWFEDNQQGRALRLDFNHKNGLLTPLIVRFVAFNQRPLIRSLSLELEETDNFDRNAYGFGFVAGFLTTACTSPKQNESAAFTKWFQQSINDAQGATDVRYKRSFGPITAFLRVTHYKHLDLGSLYLSVERSDQAATTAWPRYCTLARR